jgi:hypothetical protein
MAILGVRGVREHGVCVDVWIRFDENAHDNSGKNIARFGFFRRAVRFGA